MPAWATNPERRQGLGLGSWPPIVGQHHFLKPLGRKCSLPLLPPEEPSHPHGRLDSSGSACQTVRARAGFLTCKMLSRDLRLKIHMLLPAPWAQLSEEGPRAPCSAWVLLNSGALRGVHTAGVQGSPPALRMTWSLGGLAIFIASFRLPGSLIIR